MYLFFYNIKVNTIGVEFKKRCQVIEIRVILLFLGAYNATILLVLIKRLEDNGILDVSMSGQSCLFLL